MKTKELEEEMIHLEKRLKEKIIELGVTKVAELTKEKQPTISQYIHGDRIFSLKKIIKMAKVLRV